MYRFGPILGTKLFGVLAVMLLNLCITTKAIKLYMVRYSPGCQTCGVSRDLWSDTIPENRIHPNTLDVAAAGDDRITQAVCKGRHNAICAPHVSRNHTHGQKRGACLCLCPACKLISRGMCA